MLTLSHGGPLGLLADARGDPQAAPAAPSDGAPWHWARPHWAPRALDTLLVWQERSRQRRALARLDDRMLRDIGISRADVAAECAKPFWRG